MELKQAEYADYIKVARAVGRKHIPFCTPKHICEDYVTAQLYVVVEDNTVLATVSIVQDYDYNYTAVKRLCILNKKNCGKGIARFALREVQKIVKGRIGATPWDDNDKMKHLLEAEGFKMEYKFMGHWCFYSKEV